jgi:hypothetical protein
MKRRLALRTAIAVASLSAGATPSFAAAPHAIRPAGTAKSCRGYVRGVIGGQVKCLHRGEYCATRYRSQYVRYGLRCYGAPARLH